MSISKELRKLAFKISNQLHRRLVENDNTSDPVHVLGKRAFEMMNAVDQLRILEIGSRDVTGIVRKGQFPKAAEYVGFDILPGNNVDVVGDAHHLSDYVKKDHFDAVFSTSVYEHLLFPWKVSMEINRVLKVGGLVFTTTHPAWPEHEMPWDFWRFPKTGFNALFNKYTGFELIEVAEGIPSRCYTLSPDAPTKNMYKYTLNMGVSCLARKIGPYRDDLLKWDLDAADVMDSMYPPRG